MIKTIVITNKKNKKIGARILNAHNYPLSVLNRIVRTWESNPIYEVEVLDE